MATSSAIRPSTAAQSLAERIHRQIQGLPEGSFFGTEADLAAQHRVSHGVAREAVTRLKSLGVLESRKRRGLIVRRPDPLRLLAQSLPMLAESEHDLAELSRLRYVLEVGSIELAVLNATDEQIQQLDEYANEFESIARAGGSAEQEDELEVAFHGLILEMTGSLLVAGMQRVLSRFFNRSKQLPDPPSAKDKTIWQHHAMVSAIRDRDLERARSFVREHFKATLMYANTSKSGPPTSA